MNPSPRRGLRWLPWLGGLVAIAVMLILSLVLRVQESESRALPIARGVVARLATDDGARDVFAKNPRLAESYASADAFVEAVRSKRVTFGALPAPGQRLDRGAFQTDADPESLSVSAKGSGGAWMLLEVERSDGSEAGHAAIGEGITFLGFGDSEASLRDLKEASRGVYDESQWKRFKEVEQALLTDEGVDQLLRANPGFIKDDAARQAFLGQLQAWRPRLAAAEPPATWKQAEDSKEEMVRIYRRSMPPFSDRSGVGWRLKDGAWLEVEWDNGKLSTIRVGD